MKLKAIPFLLFLALPLGAGTHALTMHQAVERALRQNPDLIMARLDEQKAVQQVRVAKDPFIPKVYVGSGLAYTYGFPMSIEGSAPSIVQARAIASVINRPQRHRLAQTREEARGAHLDTESKRDEIVLRTVELFLDAERAAKAVKMVHGEVEGLERVVGMIRLRAAEGRELPIEVKRAELDLARARQRAQSYEADLAYLESSLASVLGFDAGERVSVIAGEHPKVVLPKSEQEAVAEALDGNTEIRRLESSLAATGYRLKAEKAAWLPRLSLVAQYGLFSKFNNYEEFFNRFQRHNGQIGISLEVPVYVGMAAKAKEAQAGIEARRLRAQLASTRSRIVLEAQKSWQAVERSKTAIEVARLDLELARENLSLLLAKMEEGRASLKEVEAARYIENEKWIAFYSAHHRLEVARYELLSRTGGLLAAISVADYSG